MINEFIRKAAAILLGMASSLALWLILHVQTRWMFGIVLLSWIAIVIVGSVLLRKISMEVLRHLPLTLSTMVAATGLLTLLERRLFQFFLILLSGCIIALLIGWGTDEGGHITTTQKPYRRMKMMLWVFDAYALLTTIFALTVFFPQIPFWALHLIGAMVFACISFMIWRMYMRLSLPQAILWMALIGLLMSQIIWVFSLLPFGYLVSGFLITWIWYLMQLLVRFHFSQIGIVWKKQGVFLGTNALLFILVLWMVKWV